MAGMFFLSFSNIFSVCVGHVHITDFNVATLLKDSASASSMAGTKPYMGEEHHSTTELCLSDSIIPLITYQSVYVLQHQRCSSLLWMAVLVTLTLWTGGLWESLPSSSYEDGCVYYCTTHFNTWGCNQCLINSLAPEYPHRFIKSALSKSFPTACACLSK